MLGYLMERTYSTRCVVFTVSAGFITVFVTRYEPGAGNSLRSWNLRPGRREDNRNNNSDLLSVSLHRALDQHAFSHFIPHDSPCRKMPSLPFPYCRQRDRAQKGQTVGRELHGQVPTVTVHPFVSEGRPDSVLGDLSLPLVVGWLVLASRVSLLLS